MRAERRRFYVCPSGGSTGLRASLWQAVLLAAALWTLVLGTRPVQAEEKLSIDELLGGTPKKTAPQAPAKPAPKPAPKKEAPPAKNSGGADIDSLLRGAGEKAPPPPPQSSEEEPVKKEEGSAMPSLDELLSQHPEESGPAETAPPENPAGETPPPEAAPSGEPPAPRPELGELGGPVAIAEIWERLLKAFNEKQFSQLTLELGNLSQAKRQLGLENLPEISNALVQLAAWARVRDRDTQLESRLLGAAEQLSPGYAGPLFARAQRAKDDKAEFVPQWIDGYLTALGQAPVRLAAKAYLLLMLSGTLLCVGFFFGLALLYRYLRSFAHDVANKLNVPAERHGKTALAVLALLLAPLSLGWGPLGVVPVWIAVLGVYGTKGERRLTPFILLSLAATPFLLLSADHYLSQSRSPALDRVVRAQSALWDPALAADLEKDVESAPDAEASRFALALVLTKEQAGEAARGHWQELLKGNPACWQAQNNVAVSQIYERNFTAAVAELQHARSGKPDAAELHYNESIALEALGESSKAQAALQQARIYGLSDVTLWESSAGNAPLTQRAVLATLPTAELMRLAKDLPGAEGQDTPFSSALGFSNPALPAALSLIALLITSVLLLLRRKLQPATACEKCGTPIRSSAQHAVQSRTTCTQCLAAFVQKKADPNSRMKKVAQVERYQRRQRWLLRFFSLLPGVAQMGAGRPITGILLSGATVLLLGLAYLFVPGPLPADNYLLAPVARWPLLFVALPLVGVIVLFSVIQMIRPQIHRE